MKLFVKAVLRSEHGAEMEGWLDPAGTDLATGDKVALADARGAWVITGLSGPRPLPRGGKYFTVTRKMS